MTKKRYKKLMYALMQRANEGHKFPYGIRNTYFRHAGTLFKAVQKIEFKDIKFNSYAEAWESLKDIRSQYGM